MMVVPKENCFQVNNAVRHVLFGYVNCETWQLFSSTSVPTCMKEKHIIVPSVTICRAKLNLIHTMHNGLAIMIESHQNEAVGLIGHQSSFW